MPDIFQSPLLYEVNLPGQYIGGEFGAIVKAKDSVKGRLCFAFPDVYTIGMSHYGMQLLYHLINSRSDWSCERAFTPYPDMEAALRKYNIPLYSLETHSPLSEFDVIGFSLQYELCFTNVLTMLDLGGVPLHCQDRTLADPLIIAGGPSAINPEPMADFIDLFVIGDGEESLPAICDAWLELTANVSGGALSRSEVLLEMARRFPFVAVPHLTHESIVRPAIISDLSQYEPPINRIVPLVECVQDRIGIEIMRGCPGRCKFCVSTVQKRPIRCRKPEDIARMAYESCMATGSNEVSLLSLSTSDYPYFDELMVLLKEKLQPLNVSISVPSLRVNHQLSSVVTQLTTDRSSGLTLAPEVALDEMRKRIGKPITNENLMAGCETAFTNGFNRVKLYFMCGLPEETNDDLDGIIELSYQIWKIGKKIRGKTPTVIANVSNFVPKPHTPWERNGMASQYYFLTVHDHLKTRVRRSGVTLKYHSLETSLLEALLCRGDRRIGGIIERAWQLGARLDSWSDYFRGDIWEQASLESGVDVNAIIHSPLPDNAELPWGYVRFS
ncbi:B12-binding domain-containing radical SAM protein [Planctomycetales bacterium]|nr:B12-binding domain-containing radical SAM protein [Planctomycetales bacterium]